MTGSGLLDQAFVLKVEGGSILVGGLAILSAIFLAAVAGSGSLQLVERSALLIVLEVILEVLEVLEGLGKLLRVRSWGTRLCRCHTTTPLTKKWSVFNFCWEYVRVRAQLMVLLVESMICV